MEMGRDFVIDRINSVMGSCVNMEQLQMAKTYSARLMDIHNAKDGIGCQKLKRLDSLIKLKSSKKNVTPVDQK
jgi:hypothetical protein